MENGDVVNLLAKQIPWALVMVYLQDWLKRQEWFPLLTYETKQMNHLFAIGLSGLTTLGISITHTGSPLTGGTVIIALPSLAVVVQGVGHWITQYIITKTSYTMMQSELNPISSKEPTKVVVMPGSKGL